MYCGKDRGRTTTWSVYSRSNAWMTTLLRASIAVTPVRDDHPECTLEEVYDVILDCLKKRQLRAKIYIQPPR